MAGVLPSFKVGSKELFLPNVSLTLLRSANLGPNHARFRVPLFFSKLDLRDYLWHVYGVEILSVRSYVQQQRVRSGKDSDIRPAIRRWHRPQAHKFMIVELARPFVWPEEPESYEEWNMDEARMGEEDAGKIQESMGAKKDTIINEDRRVRMREQAKALLEGRAQWKPPVQR